MNYEENIPEFALQPAREPGEDHAAENSVSENPFPESTPYEKILNAETPAKEISNTKETAEVKDTKEAVTIKPITSRIDYSQLKITNIKEDLYKKVTIEEDILVPDTQPDLLSVLMLDGDIKLDSNEIKVDAGGGNGVTLTGTVRVHTVYLPVYGKNTSPIITVDTPLAFSVDWNVNASPMSGLSASARIEKIEHTIINERKVRIKVLAGVELKEYSGRELELFEEIKGEEIQLLKEEIKLTDITARKRDIIDLNERLMIPITDGKPETVLKYDVSICEGHKQIAKEKAVINGIINCTIMYLERQGEYEEETLKPKYFQGKTEFTQFIPLEAMENVVGSKVKFDCGDVKLSIKEAESDPGQYFFSLEGSVTTSLEVYTDIMKEIVTDIYHNDKDIDYDTSREEPRILVGMGSTELSVRDVMNVSDLGGSPDEVIYLSGKVKSCTTTVQQNKTLVEGTIGAKLLCLGGEDGSKPFSFEEDIPFRGTVDVMGAASGMLGNTDIEIKEMWFDKINGTQIEISGNLFATTEVVEKKELKLIKNLCFVEREGGIQKKPSMVLYITRDGDDLWKIAKKYRTTMKNLKEINNIETDGKLTAGRKLLVVR